MADVKANEEQTGQPAPQSDPIQSQLPTIDALVAQMILLAAPIRLHVAQSAAEREAVYRLRYQVVVEQGWRQPDDFPDGLERDVYDEGAIHIVGWDGDTLVATARMVLPQPGRVLPTEEAFGLCVEPRGGVIDLGRFVVARAYSDQRHRVLAGVLGRCWIETRLLGFLHFCAVFASPASIRMYRAFGFKLKLLAPPRHYWGDESYPICFDVLGSTETLLKKWGGNGNADDG